jgi:hypothetical protein
MTAAPTGNQLAEASTKAKIQETMKRATQFMVDKVGPLQAEPLDEGAQPSLTVPQPAATAGPAPGAAGARFRWPCLNTLAVAPAARSWPASRWPAPPASPTRLRGRAVVAPGRTAANSRSYTWPSGSGGGAARWACISALGRCGPPLTRSRFRPAVPRTGFMRQSHAAWLPGAEILPDPASGRGTGPQGHGSAGARDPRLPDRRYPRRTGATVAAPAERCRRRRHLAEPHPRR